MTVPEFIETCAFHKMRQHVFTLESQYRCENIIPSSEVAMYCRVADKTPQLIFLSEDERYAFVLTTDNVFVEGLTAEVVPYSARPSTPSASSERLLQ